MANGLLFLKGEEIYLFAFGDNWKEASIFIKYFSMFSMGIVLKGIYTTISMSEDKMNKQNGLTFGAILVLGLNLLAYFILDLSLLYFVKFFSISIFLYWGLLLIKELYCYDKRNLFLLYFIVSVAAVSFCEIVKQFIASDTFSNILVISLLFESLMTILLFYYIKIGIRKK